MFNTSSHSCLLLDKGSRANNGSLVNKMLMIWPESHEMELIINFA